MFRPLLTVALLGVVSADLAAQTRPEDVPPRPPDVIVTDGEFDRGSPGGTCATAQDITTLPAILEFDTSLYGSGSPPGSCNTASATVMQNDAWLRWTPASDFIATVTITDVSPYDMICAIYQGSCGALLEFICLDEPEPMTATFRAEAGTTYYFQCGDWGTSPGGGTTRFELTVVSENCETAVDIGHREASFQFDNQLASANGSRGTCNITSATTMQNAVWFRWSPDANYHATLTLTELTSYDMIVQVWQGFSCFGLAAHACGDEPEPIALNFEALAAYDYYFQCGDWGTSPGGGLTQFTLDLVVANDDCADAATIFIDQQFTFDTTLALRGGGPGDCNSASATDMDNDMWYSWLAPNDLDATLIVDPTTYDGIVQVYRGSCGTLVPVACGDEPQPILLDFPAIGGETYYFQFGDWGTSPGGGLTVARLVANYDNETCATAHSITGAPFSMPVGNAGALAGLPAGSCNRDAPPAPDMRNDLWYRWIAPAAGTVIATLDDGNLWQSIMAVYRGGCASLNEIACDANDVGDGNSVTFNVNAGQTYRFQIGDWGLYDQGGAATLNLTYAPPPNDNCIDAIVITDGDYAGHNVGATNDGGSSCGSGGDNDDVWYAYNVIFDGMLNVSTCGTNDWFGTDTGMDTVLSIHEAVCPGLASNQIACNNNSNDCPQAGAVRDSSITIPVTRGQTLNIQVAQFGTTEQGIFQLHVQCIPRCPGDTNGDDRVDFADLEALLDEWGMSVSPGTGGDVSGDGDVNFLDLELLLEYWGAICH